MQGDKTDVVTNGGRLVRIDNAEETPVVDTVPDHETRLPLLGNIFLSEGKPGKVRNMLNSVSTVAVTL